MAVQDYGGSANPLGVSISSQLAGEDVARDRIKTIVSHSFLNITTATTTTVKSGSGHVARIVINKAVAAATITVYDNTAASGTKLGTVTFGAALLSDPPLVMELGCDFATGLTIVTSGATDLTVVYL